MKYLDNKIIFRLRDVEKFRMNFVGPFTLAHTQLVNEDIWTIMQQILKQGARRFLYHWLLLS